MSATDIIIANTYWEKLRYLSNDVKLRLASLLTGSVAESYELERNKTDAVRNTKNASMTEYVLSQISGKWEDERTAEEMINDIYNARKSNTIDSYQNPFEA